jgi:hypothetical protein
VATSGFPRSLLLPRDGAMETDAQTDGASRADLHAGSSCADCDTNAGPCRYADSGPDADSCGHAHASTIDGRSVVREHRTAQRNSDVDARPVYSGGRRRDLDKGKGYRQVLAATAVVLACVISACASLPPDRIAYNSIEGAVVGTQAAVKAFNELYQAGKYTDADRLKVRAAYEKFQKAAALAAAVAQAATTPEQSHSALAIINAAGDELLALIRSLGGITP